MQKYVLQMTVTIIRKDFIMVKHQRLHGDQQKENA